MILCPVIDNIMKFNNIEKLVYNGFMAFYIGMIIFYLLIIKPLFINKNLLGKEVGNMMKEYYTLNNAMKVAGIDVVFILLYLVITFLVYKKIEKILPIEYSSIKFLIVLLLVVITVDLIIGLLINTIDYKSNTLEFFRRWGKVAGFKSIFFDCLLLITIYLVMLLLIKFELNTKWHFTGLLILILLFFFSI